MKIKEQIVSEARSWIGTPFHHQGRVKNVGCDCIGLAVGVLKNLEIKINNNKVENLDEKNYPKIPISEKFYEALKTHLTQIEISEASAGDFLLIKFNKFPQHIAIISEKIGEDFRVIHSYMQSGKVVENTLPEDWKNNIHSCFRI